MKTLEFEVLINRMKAILLGLEKQIEQTKKANNRNDINISELNSFNNNLTL